MKILAAVISDMFNSVVAGLVLFILATIWLGNGGYLVHANGALTLISLIVLGLAIYFLPTIVANGRGHRHVMAIFCTNFFLGWTFIGWVAALVWSCMNTKTQSVQVVQPVRVVDPRWHSLRA